MLNKFKKYKQQESELKTIKIMGIKKNLQSHKCVIYGALYLHQNAPKKVSCFTLSSTIKQIENQLT